MLSVGSVLINLYCIAALVSNEKTRKLDYYLLLVQNILDFIFSALYSSVYSALVAYKSFHVFCQAQVRLLLLFYMKTAVNILSSTPLLLSQLINDPELTEIQNVIRLNPLYVANLNTLCQSSKLKTIQKVELFQL